MEVLNTYSTYNELLAFLPTILITFCIFFIIGIIVNLIIKEWKSALVCLLISVLCFGVSLGLIAWWNATETKNYEVIITDYNKVDFNKYQIVEKKGQITVLKEIKIK